MVLCASNLVNQIVCLLIIDANFLKRKTFLVTYQVFLMFTPISSLHLLSLAIIVVFIVLPSANGVDDGYSTCSSLFTCGNITNIGYPFWGDGRPKYCGQPELQLQCLNDLEGYFPYLKFGPDVLSPFPVLNMTFSGNNITLKLQVPQETPCTDFHKKDFGEIFQLSNTVEIINLLYNCNKGIVSNHSDGSFLCHQNQTAIPNYYVSNFTAHQKYSSCKLMKVPVLKKEMDLYNNKGHGNLSDVIKKGFEVNYEYSSECTKCKNSGCICGSSLSTNFDCLCKPGKKKLLLRIAISGVIIILLIGLSVGLYCHKKHKFRTPVPLSRMISTDRMITDLETNSSFHGIPVFLFNELQEATNNFDATQELGDGGFGIVYYGKLRDGREVAVKRLYEKNYKQVGQFMNEVEILTRLRHPNLVTLYGCTSRHSKVLLLVYEYISNGTVADHLHGDRSGSKSLTWAIRMKIAIETASALSYLHTSEIVHRDVKTTNILLDNNFSVKVADFGLSRLFPVDMNHVSTAPQGTPGYLDPEYHKCYQVTNKSDVYSFGVVLVELISSLPAVDITRQEGEMNLSDYAMNRIQRGVLDELVDQKLGYNSDFKVKRMITLVAELAFQCLQQEKDVRPFMTEVLETLMRIENLDYKALEAEEMDGKRSSISVNDDIQQPPASPCSVIDNWAMKSITSNPSS